SQHHKGQCARFHGGLLRPLPSPLEWGTRQDKSSRPCYTTPRKSRLRSGGARMNILLLGSGGREHALAWKIAASPLVEKLYCAPGNAGIARECELVALDPADHAGVIAFCQLHRIDLVVV